MRKLITGGTYETRNKRTCQGNLFTDMYDCYGRIRNALYRWDLLGGIKCIELLESYLLSVLCLWLLLFHGLCILYP